MPHDPNNSTCGHSWDSRLSCDCDRQKKKYADYFCKLCKMELQASDVDGICDWCREDDEEEA